jgi:hypothetical protein
MLRVTSDARKENAPANGRATPGGVPSRKATPAWPPYRGEHYDNATWHSPQQPIVPENPH